MTWYDATRRRAAILLWRWGAEGVFEQPLPVQLPRGRYRLEDVDTGQTRMMESPPGLSIRFDAVRKSALLFLEPAD